ncbi:MAG: hypothetical protein R3E75_08245 [Steroidobacteraceae bacterium]|nr:hypothetical protein [Nevskiaceae bacterium]MCP5359904.1 hypothetical protein [Nevskiaceae bacterium]MCP5472277.1 hypothetical protein [Nevskiaceae bacterium]
MNEKPRRHVITLACCTSCTEQLDAMRAEVGPDGHGFLWCPHLNTLALLAEGESVLYRPCADRQQAELFGAAATMLRARVDVAKEAAAGADEPRH